MVAGTVSRQKHDRKGAPMPRNTIYVGPLDDMSDEELDKLLDLPK
jgi:hypothetical protein